MAVRCTENDIVLGSIIERLRREKKIARYDHGLQSSRFDVSSEEWGNEIKPVWAQRLASTRAKFGWTRLLRPMFSLNFTRICRAKTTAKPIRGYGMRNASSTWPSTPRRLLRQRGACVRLQARCRRSLAPQVFSALWQCSNPAQRDSDP